jgi:hypothetical protein
MAELRDLENDVAIKLLNVIKEAAASDIGTASLNDLAQAYATVVGAAPGPPRSKQRVGTIG